LSTHLTLSMIQTVQMGTISIMHYGIHGGCVEFNYLFYVRNGKPNRTISCVSFVR